MLIRIKQSIPSFAHNKSYDENYLDWVDYKSKINFLDDFAWQQKVRRQSVKNI